MVDDSKYTVISPGRVELKCDTCGKTFLRKLSALKKSRSGYAFCTRNCKDRAARIDGIEGINKSIKHGKYVNYRRHFNEEDLKCVRCGYNEFVICVDVHHIDENHLNSDPDNLLALCANCHRGLHNKLWKLDDLDEKFQTVFFLVTY